VFGGIHNPKGVKVDIEEGMDREIVSKFRIMIDDKEYDS